MSLADALAGKCMSLIDESIDVTNGRGRSITAQSSPGGTTMPFCLLYFDPI